MTTNNRIVGPSGSARFSSTVRYPQESSDPSSGTSVSRQATLSNVGWKPARTLPTEANIVRRNRAVAATAATTPVTPLRFRSAPFGEVRAFGGRAASDHEAVRWNLPGPTLEKRWKAQTRRFHPGSGRRTVGGMEFRVLGPLEVVDCDGSIPLGGPKQRTVL